jgi:hypothetical protein
MMGWLAIFGLAVAAFGVTAIVLRLPREGWTLFAAALVFGLAALANVGIGAYIGYLENMKAMFWAMASTVRCTAISW